MRNTKLKGCFHTNRALHNVLVIGLTNRKELLDLALLRPGRFEVQIEIGLPDEMGRWEIFHIHTRQMEKHGYLAKDVDLRQLASNTTQFSGAEIAGLVRLATSYALDRKVRFTTLRSGMWCNLTINPHCLERGAGVWLSFEKNKCLPWKRACVFDISLVHTGYHAGNWTSARSN